MTRKELVSVVAEKANISKCEANKFMLIFLEEIGNCLANGGTVHLSALGTFKTRVREERTMSNPITGESVKVSSCRVPSFKPGKKLKEKVSKSKRKTDKSA